MNRMDSLSENLFIFSLIISSGFSEFSSNYNSQMLAGYLFIGLCTLNLLAAFLTIFYNTVKDIIKFYLNEASFITSFVCFVLTHKKTLTMDVSKGFEFF